MTTTDAIGAIDLSVSEGNPNDNRRLIVTVAEHGLSVIAIVDEQTVATLFTTPEALWEKVTA